MEINQPLFWKNKTVLITGHTGFKGTWLTLMLLQLGAKVIGVSKHDPELADFFYNQLKLDSYKKSGQLLESEQDISLGIQLQETVDFVFHLAAQSVVGESYLNPVETYQTNVMGSVHLLNWINQQKNPLSVIYVTTDKVYQKNDQPAFVESDALGGFYDPYSTSKACADWIARSYYESFLRSNNIRMAIVRAGNVIGGGDGRSDRLVPDVMKHLFLKDPLRIRTAQAVRPWQSVFAVLKMYLNVASYLVDETADLKIYNIGPHSQDHWTVQQMVNYFYQLNQTTQTVDLTVSNHHRTVDSSPLFLNSDKIQTELRFAIKPNLQKTLDETFKWYQTYYRSPQDIAQISQELVRKHVSI